ncbi:DNA repair XRCC3-like protein [Micractinium conductrix]|uniref:DNA repair XRCC3-like protein n=1 Tax=Micractinium conductrix TaxID=554055 RepID=A0A2P6VFQ5_9CHLO|nr:DNA repair XRCC3-like protein [Micractinium conductrix]|eukprot:PSC72908.1 DNA repair XRCC3-like protein [Micractinium conductrix]
MPVSLRPRPLASLPTERLSTGCPHLDAALSGGLPVGSLTEVAGEAAASKTQLSLQLLLTAQLPHEAGGLGGSAVYIYTEGEPPLRRLHQLAQALPLRYAPKVLAGLPYPASNVFVEKSVANGADLLARVQRLRPLLERQRRAAAAAGGGATLGGAAAGSSNSGSGIAARPVRLLVIDSVAHVFRDLGETGGGVGELAGRTELLFRMSTLLRRLADEFSLAVLLVNQVVDAVTDEAAPTSSGMQLSSSSAARHAALTGGLRLVSLGREVVPALGLAWANCVNTRLFLARCGAAGLQAVFHGAPSAAAAAAAAAAAGGSGGASAPALRKLQVLFSPHLPQTECHYVVEATGVRGLHPAEVDQHDAAAAAAAWEAAQQEAQERRAWQATQQQQHWQEQQQEQCQPPPQQHQQGQWQQQQGQQQPPPPIPPTRRTSFRQPVKMAKRLLASTFLASVLPQNSLVSVTTGCRLESAVQVMNAVKILSVPVLQRGEYHGCISVNDLLKNLALALNAKKPHWLESGAAAFTADELVAVGKELAGKSVGELDHSGSLFLLNAQTTTSMLDFVQNSFDIKDSTHHVHHRVYVCLAPGTDHTTQAGATTVVNATHAASSSGKLAVTHVVSHLDVVRLLAANKAALGGAAEQSVEALGLTAGAVFCVPASTPAVEAFGRMAVDHKSCLGLVDAAGKLVGNLSASDLRGLVSAEAFATLLSSAVDYDAAQRGGQNPALGTVTADTTLGELLDMLVAGKMHRVYVVDSEGKPISIITLTDVLRWAASA